MRSPRRATKWLAVDLLRPSYERRDLDEPRYLQADLTDAGEAFAAIRGAEAVVPLCRDPRADGQRSARRLSHEPDDDLQLRRGGNPLRGEAFRQRLLGDRPRLLLRRARVPPDYLPIDEEHPLRPQDPYALSKVFGEQLMDAAVQRSDIRGPIDPPCWCNGRHDRMEPRPQVRGPHGADRQLPLLYRCL